jgi:hypothetical protein
MTTSAAKINKYIFLIPPIILYGSYLLGFFLNEDSNGGAFLDYKGYIPIIYDFVSNFNNTFLNFDKYGERHSPILIIILSFLYKINIDDTLIRLINLNFSIISIIFFFKCLKIKFNQIDNRYLFLISIIFFLSPTFRSLSIWPDSRIYGFHFFIISTFFYLKFIHSTKKVYFCYLNILFLAISSYFSPNFSLFSIFFLYQFYKRLDISKELFFCIVVNLILAFPAFYYLFVLDVFFLSSGHVPGSDQLTKLGIPIQYNISNKILIISSILMFYFIPILIIKKKILLYSNKIEIKNFIFLFLICLLMAYTFNYELDYTGGGIFLHISNFLFKNNLLFYLISFYSFIFIFKFCVEKFENFFLIVIIFLSNPQLSIYHKYYDPLIIFLIFTLFKIDFDRSFFKLKNISIIYLFYAIFLCLNLLKSYI